MPELPDLQVFSRNLSQKLVGKKVERLTVPYKKKLKTPEKDLRKAIEDTTLTSVYRDGKELHFAFGNGNVLGLHMMLKGQLHLFHETHQEKYPIIELLFTDRTGLTMTDWQGQATPTLNPPQRDAPDALSKSVSYGFLREKLGNSKAAIKKVLMDQEIIRGIGNAYADEILWDARISPFSISNKIPDTAVRMLLKSIRAVLTKAEKKIFKACPGIISGEVRDFVAVHNASLTESPTGAKILTDSMGGRKTYYTDEQRLYS